MFTSKRKVRFLRAAAWLGLAVVFVLAPAAAAQSQLGRGRISGGVVDENGKPIEGAKVVVQSLTSPTRFETVSDAKGRFAVGGMGSGEWSIAATRDGYAPGSVEVRISQLKPNTPATIALKKLAGVEAFKADKSSSEMYDQGNRLYAEGRHDEAIAIFEAIAEKYPEIYQVHLNLGANHLKRGDLDKAQSEFQLALDKTLQVTGSYDQDKSTAMRGFAGLGEIALKRGDFETAQKHFKQALEISPLDEAAAYNVGEIFFSNQKIDEAIAYFELAIKIKKDWSKPYNRLGMVYLNKGDLAKARESFQAFITMDPANPEAANAKAMIAAIDKIKNENGGIS